MGDKAKNENDKFGAMSNKVITVNNWKFPKYALRDMKKRWAPIEPTEVFMTYWWFACERQKIFFHRLHNEPQPWTDDSILQNYKFTNSYRASDRVSQYLIKNVIYSGPQDVNNLFFRILLFKLFNRIDTWEFLENKFGDITWPKFNFSEYNKFLSNLMNSGKRLYSAAYVMPSPMLFGYERKHSNHLKLLIKMMEDNVPEKVSKTRNMIDVFELLRSYASIGDFLAYQFTIDLNYSSLIDFSEMELVIPGPGAKSGIIKCFTSTGGLNEIELIQQVTLRQQEEFTYLELEFLDLGGRALQLIDCQNLFCEVDKYSRQAHPDRTGSGGRMRIKQKFLPNYTVIDYFYPPKWGINGKL